MRALNLGLFAVVGGIAGLSACADDPQPPEIVPGPNMPFPTGGSNTGGITATGGRLSGSGGRASSNGGTSSRPAACPMEEPDDGDSCTTPTDGTTLKCVYEVTTTCTCKRSAFSNKATWDCVTSTAGTSTGGRSGASSGTGGRATGGRAASGGGTAKAGGFGF